MKGERKARNVRQRNRAIVVDKPSIEAISLWKIRRETLFSPTSVGVANEIAVIYESSPVETLGHPCSPECYTTFLKVKKTILLVYCDEMISLSFKLELYQKIDPLIFLIFY